MTRRDWTLGLLVVLAGGLIAAASAGTDPDAFDKVIAKVAIDAAFGEKLTSKVACVRRDARRQTTISLGLAGSVVARL
jgi:hypothetical protein